MWKERGLIQVRVAQIDTGINSLGGLSPLEKSDRKLDKCGGFIMFFEVRI